MDIDNNESAENEQSTENEQSLETIETEQSVETEETEKNVENVKNEEFLEVKDNTSDSRVHFEIKESTACSKKLPDEVEAGFNYKKPSAENVFNCLLFEHLKFLYLTRSW